MSNNNIPEDQEVNNARYIVRALFEPYLFHQGRSLVLPSDESFYDDINELVQYDNIINDLVYSENDRMLRIGMNESLNYYKTQEKKPNIKLNVESCKATIDHKQYDCSICKSGFMIEEDITILLCNHILHTDCISEWVKYKSDCPVCRAQIPTIDTLEKTVNEIEDDEDQYNENEYYECDECDECYESNSDT